MYPIIEDVTQRFKKYVTEKVSTNSKNAFNARSISAKYTCDVVSSCAFGVDAQSFKTENPEILTMGKKFFAPTLRLSLVFLLMSVSKPMMKLLGLSIVTKDVAEFFTKLIEDAIKYREEHEIDRKDYLEYLMSLKSKKNLKPVDMAAHGITFFTDGFDTSSVGISNALYEVSKPIFDCNCDSKKIF